MSKAASSCRSWILLNPGTEALAVDRTTGRPDVHMTLDVLSFMQPAPAASPGELGGGSDSTPGAEAPAQGFASVFAQLMPGSGDGQSLAAAPDLSTGDDPAAAEPDPALAWLTMPALSQAGANAVGLGLQSKAVGLGQMQLITPSQPSPDIEGDGLVAFAQGQGLDEAALQRLFGERARAKPVAPPVAVVSAAAWIAGGQKSMGVQVPVVDPDAVIDALPERLALEKMVLTLTPGKRLLEAGSNKPPEPPDLAGSVGEDGRVDLDLDVAGLLGELAPEADLKALKAEERAALSLRIGEMLAQRMVAQAQRGQWQLRFALNPQNLGRVEIDMQMRGGELEATFAALNPATRELLQEALPRLREMLQQSGMDVASLNIGSGGAFKNGGQPTPPKGEAELRDGSPGGEHAQADAATPKGRVQGADGWDIWV
jgi:hypothetical protein